ncbi:CU044_2847 family protein [Candidatus Chloroploca asiatica]|uniref:Trypsin-co-occurring domain-containing protein n=1 Tax=Candidatus Chloroploca asiatica TaxID=1506545 RepID=A0A2H3KGM9_9CHLR|nr:CU044_2847 family protein [Candidatus Chloroploca asiatica]PDV96869.1 hypothetical protein A9Q02_20025 [Candidatus Chloroploca asiatica]
MEENTKRLPVVLPNGTRVFVETSVIQSEMDVSATEHILKFPQITEVIEGVWSMANDALQKIDPKKAAIEFGIEVGFEPGLLTAVLVKGSTKGNLKITIEWER